jgi:ribokinase
VAGAFKRGDNQGMITVVGSINMDLIANVARLPKPGETLAGTAFATAAGGKGANQALAARRAGADVAMVGAVGADGFADEALALLAEAGADLDKVARVEGATGIASILVGAEDGDNVIVVVAGANGEVGADAAKAAVDRMGKDDALLLQMEIPAPAIEAALRAARDRSIRSILNVAPLTEDAIALAPLASIVIANETEFALLCRTRDQSAAEREDAMQAMSRDRDQTIIVTLGADGVMAFHDGRMHHVQGLSIKPVDTVGAGDTFCGYLATGLDAGLDFELALRRAAVAGSLACLKPGAQPSIPTAVEVDAALADTR